MLKGKKEKNTCGYIYSVYLYPTPSCQLTDNEIVFFFLRLQMESHVHTFTQIKRRSNTVASVCNSPSHEHEASGDTAAASDAAAGNDSLIDGVFTLRSPASPDPC